MADITFRSDMTVELVQSNASDESVVWAARVSTAGDRAAEPVTEEKKTGLINYLLKNRHMSPFEHGQMTFFIQAPIFVFREFHRHRTWSYNEESGRYKEMDGVFYIAGPDRNIVQTGKPGHYVFVPGTPEQYARHVARKKNTARVAYQSYLDDLEDGICRELARTDLTFNLYSSMYATVNPRNLMQFLSLRTISEDAAVKSYPQQEIVYVADQIEALWAKEQPITHAAWVANGRR